MTRRLHALIWGLTGIVVLAALVLWLRPVSPRNSALPIEPSMASVPVSDTTWRADAEDIAVYNIFSPARTPPAKRFVLANDSASASTEPGAPPQDSVMAPGDPKLFGTVIRDSESLALLLLDAQQGALLYRVGDRAAGYRVISIDRRSVVLVGPRGRVTLRLDEEDRA